VGQGVGGDAGGDGVLVEHDVVGEALVVHPARRRRKNQKGMWKGSGKRPAAKMGTRQVTDSPLAMVVSGG